MPKNQEPTDLKGLESRIKCFCEDRDWDQFHDIKELAIGISTEAAELLELFRFQTLEQCAEQLRDPVKREKIEDEIADIFFFILRIAGRFDVDLARAVERKMAKNAVRYPVEKAKGSNRKYDEL